MRIKRWGPVLGVLHAVVGTGCPPECDTNRDCPSGTFQCIDNACVVPDAGPPRPDLGFVDVGPLPPPPPPGPPPPLPLPPPGQGAPRDTGVDEAPDAGFVADPPPIGPSDFEDAEALVEIGVILDTDDSGPTLAEARIVDYSASNRTLVVRQQDGCTIRERGPGVAQGLTATRFDISNAGRTLALFPVLGSPGVYRPTSSLNPELLIQQGTTVSYRIVSPETPGTLSEGTVTTGLPVAALIPSPNPSFTYPFFSLNLAGPASQGANRFEVYDSMRSTVVDCPLDNTSLGLPLFITDLYPAGSEVTVDIRSQAVTIQSIEVIDRGFLPVTFRASRVLRYTVTMPEP